MSYYRFSKNFRYLLISFLLLGIFANEALAQAPVFQNLTQSIHGLGLVPSPVLRREVRGVAVAVNLDRRAVVYYAIYRVTGANPNQDPGVFTPAEVKAGTTPPPNTTRVFFGQFGYGDGTYCVQPPNGCGAVVGDIVSDRVVSFSSGPSATYKFYLVAETWPLAGALSAVEVRSTTNIISSGTNFLVGSTTLAPNKGKNFGLNTKCSPGNISLEITYTGSDLDPSLTVNALVNFGDFGATGTATPMTLQTDLTGNGTVELNKQFRRYRVNLSHDYDYDAGANPALNPTGSACTFEIDFGLLQGGSTTTIIPNTDQEERATIWDDPGTARGVQDVNPNGMNNDDGGANDEEFEICQGDRTAINLVDNSTYNCTDNEEARATAGLVNSPNYEARWVQFVYGAAGTNITNGAPAASANDKLMINNISFDNTQYITGQPIYGPVVYYAAGSANAINAAAAAYAIRMPRTAQDGEKFVVLMRSWNTCLQYDNDVSDANGLNPTGGTNDLDLGVNNNNRWFTAAGAWPGNHTTFPNAIEAPVEFVKEIVIVGAPAAPTFTPGVYCEDQTATTYVLTGSPSTAGLTYNFFNTSGGASVRSDNSAPYTWIPVTGGGHGGNIPSNTPGTYTRFATTTAGVGNGQNCTSPEATITLVIETAVSAGAIAHAAPLTFCENENPPAFTSPTAASGGRDGTPTYQWQSSATAGGPYTDIGGATAATYDPPALTATTYYVRKAISDNSGVAGVCASAITTEIGLIVQKPVQPGSISGDQVVCSGVTNPPLISSTGPATDGDLTTAYAYRWQISTTSAIAGFTDIADVPPGSATGLTYDPPAAITQDTWYRRRVTSGVTTGTCTGVAVTTAVKYSINVAVNPGSIGTSQVICAGVDPALLTSSAPATGGDGLTYAYQWQSSTDNFATAPTNIGGATGLTYDPPVLGVGTTYFRRRARSPSAGAICADDFTNVVVITVNPLPTASLVLAGGAVCAGNPAPDISWNLTAGSGPFEITYTITKNGAPFATIGPVTEGSSTFLIDDPNPDAGGVPGDSYVYEIITIKDVNDCNASAAHLAALGTGLVTIGTAPPAFDAARVLTPSSACNDAGATTDPVLSFSLNAASTSAGTYILTYQINPPSANLTKNFTVNVGNGDATGLTFSEGALDGTGTHTIRIVSIQTPAACQTTFNEDLTFTVNARPAAPTNGVPGYVCVTSGTGAPISVADPGAGFTIVWSSTAAPTFTAATGTTGGTRGNTFTPTSNATVTYHAFTRSDVNPTNCLSVASLAVQHFQDLTVTTSNAGTAAANCTGNFTLGGNAPGGTEYGTWTVPGILYQQPFTGYPNNATISGAPNGWTINSSGAGVFAGGTGYLRIMNAPANPRFEANDVDGTGTAGADIVWQSPVINGAFTGVSVSVDLTSSATLENGGPTPDYIRVYKKINGGAEVALATNGMNLGNLTGTVVASETGINVATSFQLVIHISNNAADEFYRFDNIVVRTATGPTITDPNVQNTTVNNLPVGANTLTWTISSQYGVCPSSATNVILTRDPLPAIDNQAIQLCASVGSPGTAVGIQLTDYNEAVANGITANRTVSWTRTAPGAPAALGTSPPLQDITNAHTYTALVTATVPATGCQNTATVTFNVNTLPAAVDHSDSFCEDAVNAGVATGINLISYEATIRGGAPAGQRLIEWYEDNAGALGALIPSGVAGGQSGNYQISATKIVHAKVIDQTSPVTPKCFDIADMTLTYKPKPVNNPISGNSVVCTSNNGVVYQIDPSLNNFGADHRYTWTVTPGAAVPGPGLVDFQVTIGGGTNSLNSFIFIKFPGPRVGPVTITAQEIIDGCAGNIASFNVTVAGAPPGLAFASPATQVCKGATQAYSLTTANTGSTYNWTVVGGTVVGSTTTIGASTISIVWGTAIVPQPSISVTETSSSGCSGAPASIDITLNDVPQMTSGNSASICSNTAPGATLPFTSTMMGSTTFSWKIMNATGNVTFSGAAIPIFPAAGSTGTGNLAHLLTNTSGVNGTVIYEVTPIETNAPTPPDCAGIPQTITVTVKPEPVVTAVSNIIVCPGDAVPAVNFAANTAGGETFDWTNTNTAIGLGTSGSGNITTYTAPANNTGANVVGTIVVEATKNGCTSAGTNSKTFTITIRPQPVVTAVANVTACSGTAIAAINFAANTGGGETFNWTNTNTAVGLAASGTGNIAAFTAGTNTSGADITATIIVSATLNGCTSLGANTKSFIIRIQPEPVVAAVPNITVCPGQLITPPAFTANTGGGETFAWTNNNTAVGLAASGSGNIANYTAPANNTGADVVANISVVATATTTCVGQPTMFTITVKPEPVVTAIANVSVCSGDPVAGIAFTANTGGGETFNWTNTNTSTGLAANGTGSIAGYTAPVNLTGADIVGTVTVTATKNSCTSAGANSKSFTVTIKPQPVVAAVTSVSVCSGDPVAAIAFSANTGGGETFNWTNSNISVGLAATGSGDITAFTAPNNFTGVDIVGTIVVSATKNGCTSVGANSKTFTLTIKPQPVVGVIPNVSVCSGDPIAAINFLANTGGGETFSWTNTNTLIGLPASNSGNIAAYTAPNNFTGADITGTITVSATKNGCTSSGANSKSFTITIRPQPVVAVVTNVSVCSGDAVPGVTFTANTGGSETFNWTNSNPAIGLSANGTGAIGTYTAPNNFTGADMVGSISVSATMNGCTSTGANSKVFTITIRPQPVVTAVANVSVCSGDAVPAITFSANTGGGEVFDWTNSDTATGLALSGTGNIATFTAPNNFSGTDIVSTITVSATKNSCVSAGANMKSFTLTIKPQPVVTAVSNVSVCSGDPISTINFAANTGGGETFNWSNNNTSIGLGATGSGSIPAYTAPNNFTGADIVGTITVTATKNGCTSAGGNAKTFTITIKPQPVVAAIANVSVCSGAAIAAINFTANTGGSETFNWTNTNAAVGVAASGSGGIGAYTAPVNTSGSDIVGTITVSATKNGCTSAGANSKSFTITIKPEPVVANVTDVSVCSGASISAISFAANTGGSETFNWTNSNIAIGLAGSGTGNISSYTAPINISGADIVGTLTVTATKNGCTSAGANVETFTITIKPEPVVAAITNVSVCSGDAIAAINFTANTGGSETFNWANNNTGIGLAATGTGGITSYTAPINISGSNIVGTITVTATKNGCVSAGANLKTFTITIRPEPVVTTVANVSVCSGDLVPAIAFTANTGGSEVFDWTNTNNTTGLALSGTGNISSYTAPNNFTGADLVSTVTVTATKNSCTSTGANAKSFTITIKPQPVVAVVTNISVCSGDAIPTVNFFANTGGGETFNWTNTNTSIGIGSSGSGSIPTYTAPNNFTGSDIVGTITVTATKNGCTSAGANAKSYTVTIKPQPVVGAVANISVCSEAAIAAINFTANTGGSETFNWTNTNAAIGIATSGTGGIGAYTAPINITGADIVGTIVVTATKNGCTSAGANSKTFTITIRPEPVVTNVADISVCSGQPISGINFVANTGGGETFSWTNSNAVIGLSASGVGNIAAYTAPINISGADIAGTITVSGAKNGCTSTGANRETFTITIKPEPVVAVIGNVSVCSGAAVPAISFTANTGGSETFNWSNNNLSIGLAGSGTGGITSYTAPVNITGSDIIGTITVTATKNGCVSTGANSKSFTVTIKPEPVVASVPNVSVCSGAAIAAINFSANTGGSETFNWTNTETGIGLAASGSGNIGGYTAPVNLTGADIIGSIVVSATKNGCTSVGANSKTFTITIKPEPVVDAVTNVEVCSGASISTISFAANTGGGETFSWTNTNSAVGISTSGLGNIPGYTAPINISGANIVGTVVVSAAKNGCTSVGANRATFTITIKPEPVVANVTDVSVCSGAAISGINFTANTGGAETFDWTNTNPAIGIAVNGSGPIAGYTAPINITGVDIVGTITVVATKNGCVSAGANRETFTITIKPQPVVSAIANVQVCSDGGVAAIVFTANTGGGTSFNWTNTATAVGLGASGLGNIPGFTAGTNTSLVDIVATVTVHGTSNGCTSAGANSKSFTITLHPEPLAPALTTIAVCSGQAINFDLQDIVDAVGGNDLPSKFKYTVVADRPLDLAPTVFPGLFDRSTASTALITDAFSNFNPSLGGDVTLTYTVTPLSQAFDCEGTPFTFKVVIHPEPVGQNLIDPLCATVLNHNMQTQITNGIPSTFSYTVVSDNVGVTAGADRSGFTSAPIGDTYVNNTGVVANIVYTITARSTANSCTGSATFSYTARIFPTPIGNSGPVAAVCSDVTYTIDPQAAITNSVTITKYDWAPTYNGLLVNGNPPPAGQTNFVGNIVGTLTNEGGSDANATFQIIPYAGVCAGPSFTLTQPIRPEPVLATTLDEVQCSDIAYGKLLDTNGVSIPAAANGYNVSAVMESGLTGVPSTSATGANNLILANSFNNLTSAQLKVTYTIIPTGTNGCVGNSKDVLFRVNPEPVINPALATGNIVCSDLPIELTLATNGTSVAANFFVYKDLQNPLGTPIASAAGNAVPDPTETVTGYRPANVIFADKYTNATGAAFNRIYLMKPVSPSNCIGDQLNITVQILPEPDFAFVVPPPVCSDVQIGLQLNQTGATAVASYQITEVNWDTAPSPGLIPGGSNNGVTTYAAVGGNYTVIGTYTNGTNTPLNARYKIVPIAVAVSGKSCIGDERTGTVQVQPSPVVLTNLSKIVCNDAINGITIGTLPATAPAASYIIDRPLIPAGLALGAYVPGTVTAVGASTNNIASDHLINTTNNPVVLTYTVRANTNAVPASGCSGPAQDILVTVEPQIRVTLDVTTNLSPDICSGVATNIVMDSPSNPTAGNVTFNYSAVPSPLGTVSGLTPGFGLSEGDVIGGAVFPQNPVNSSNNFVDVTYTVTPRATGAGGVTPGGCAGIANTTVVRVQPKPKLVIPAFKTICEDTGVGIALNSPTNGTSAVSFNYTTAIDAPGAAGDITGFSTIGGNFVNNTTITDVLVNTQPATRSMTYTLTPGFGSCVGDPVTSQITVSPRPVINPLTNFEICSGGVFNPVTVTYDTDPSTTIVNWTVVPDALVTGEAGGAGDQFSQVLFNNSNDSRTLTYSFVATNAANSPTCPGAALPLTITVYPIPTMTAPASRDVCFNSLVSIPLASNKLNTEYRWDAPDNNGGDPDLPPIPAGSASGATPAITQTFVNNGTDLKSYQYSVIPFITVPSTGERCDGIDKSIIVNVAPQLTATLANADGDDEIYLCKGSKDFLYFTFGGHPNFDYTYTEAGVTKTVTRKGYVDLASVQPAVTTTYVLQSAKDGFGCTTPFNQTVTVFVDEPDANFAVVQPSIQCSPFPYDFQYNRRADVTYAWKWGDGTEETYFSSTTNAAELRQHIFTNPSPSSTPRFKVTMETYLDTLKYQTGCLKRNTIEVRLHPKINAQVFPDKDVICSDEQILFVNSSQGATIHKWYYRAQGTTSQNEVRTTQTPLNYRLPNTTTTNPLVIEVVYEANNAAGCAADPVVTPITVYRGMDAGFTHGPLPKFVGGHAPVNFTNTTVPIDASEFRYEWDFGIMAVPQNVVGTTPPVIDYTRPGVKEVVLLVTNMIAEADGLTCANEHRETLEILRDPIEAKFVAVPLEACFPTDITITENTSTADIYNWRVIDNSGIAASSNSPLPVFKIPRPGKYTVELTASDSFTGEQKTALQEVIVYNLPMASFDVRPGLVFVPDGELQTFNFSDGANEYEWDFGDGTVKFEKEPTHTYRVEGIYTIMMIAKNDHGSGVVCADTLTSKITAKQGGVTRVPNAFTPNATGATTSLDPNNPNSGNGGSSGGNGFNDVFLPQVKGADEFNMQIFDRWGNLIFESNNANVGWDGYDRSGRFMPAGVYVYKLTLRLSDGQRTTQVGDITMIR